MEQKVYRPGKLQELLLILISLSPVVCVWHGLFIQNSAWLTLVSFHIGLTVLPALFKVSFVNTQTFEYFKGECESVLEQLKNGAILGASVSAIITIAGLAAISNFYHAFGLISGLAGKTCDDFAMDCDGYLGPVSFAIYFSLVNPIVEESYWRLFLLKSFSDKKSKKITGSLLYSFYHWVNTK
jgi:membrane protease YdiL (CAAX protease family)